MLEQAHDLPRRRRNGNGNGNGAGHTAPQLTNRQTTSHKLSRQEYANLINGARRKKVEDTQEICSHLKEAQRELEPAEYKAMLKNDLEMGEPSARKHRIIAESPILMARAHVHALPASWGTLYELSKLKDEVLLALIEDGTVNPKMERKEAEALRHPPPRKVPQACPVCKDTAKVKAGHKWSKHDDVEDQANAAGFVEDIVIEIEGIFGSSKNSKQLRAKIERVRDERLHPTIRETLAGALRELATIANRLADELEAPEEAAA